MAPSPDADLRALWADIAPPGVPWAPLTGGNTNALWRVGDVVIKRFVPGAETPLFGNDPKAEALALGALRGTGLAPDLLDVRGSSLAYAHVAGRIWSRADGVAPVAKALRALHDVPPPAGLPLSELGAARLMRQCEAMGGAAPEVSFSGEIDPVFLHGDATAGNALVTAAGLTFIDWQCPAIGDPCDDIAVFLSPAMQVISGNDPLTEAEVSAFLSAYGDGAVAARYRALAPLYHARMKAYCRWRAARGDAGYLAAADAEVKALR